MIVLDPTKTNIFIWVPGTGGHEVHPAFKDAAEKASHGDCQFICIDYPASVDFIASVQKGVKELSKILKKVSHTKLPEQKVFLGGSSQGAWVIGEALAHDALLKEIPNKVVMFGHPGMSADHVKFDEDANIWEINNPNDAVTFGWNNGERAEIAKGLSDMYRFRPRGFAVLLKYMVKKPRLLWRLFVLIILHTKIINWVTSPHDNSNEMPLAVYWLLH